MRFSIIIPTYNCVDRLGTTLESIAFQKDAIYEVIVQDGGSVDGIELLVNEYKARGLNIRLICCQDSGIYDAMNKAVKSACGDYCLFLGAGDEIYGDHVLSDFEKFIIENPCPETDVAAYYGYVYESDGVKEEVYSRKIDWRYKTKFNPICHQAVLAKRELLMKYPFDTKYKVAADQDWIMKLLKKGYGFCHVDIPVAWYMLDGFSSENEALFLREQDVIHKTYYPICRIIRRMWRRLRRKPL